MSRLKVSLFVYFALLCRLATGDWTEASTQANGFEFVTKHLLSYASAITPGRITDEERLLRTVMRNYDSASRPVYNASHTTTVDFGMSLVQIQKLVRHLAEFNHQFSDF